MLGSPDKATSQSIMLVKVMNRLSSRKTLFSSRIAQKDKTILGVQTYRMMRLWAMEQLGSWLGTIMKELTTLVGRSAHFIHLGSAEKLIAPVAFVVA